MTKVGYARVSTKDQNLDMQLAALEKAGCEKIYIEKISAKKVNRPELNKMLRSVKKGDVIAVWKMDRIARSVRHACEIVDQLKKKQVALVSITEGIDTSTALGNTFYKLATIIAETEINNLSERTKEGLIIARLKGKILGRPRGISISQEKLDTIISLSQNGVKKDEISKITNIPLSTIYRYLKISQKNHNNTCE